MIDFSDMTRDTEMGARTFVRRRPTVVNPAGLEGETVPTYEDTPLIGIVLPAKTSDAKLLPEGIRLDDVNAFYTADNVRAGDGRDTLPDVLIVDNTQFYRALRVQDFSRYGMYKVLAQRFVPPPEVEIT